jgi:hypothetical protein
MQRIPCTDLKYNYLDLNMQIPDLKFRSKNLEFPQWIDTEIKQTSVQISRLLCHILCAQLRQVDLHFASE